jgi:hypothetical protein
MARQAKGVLSLPSAVEPLHGGIKEPREDKTDEHHGDHARRLRLELACGAWKHDGPSLVVGHAQC